MIFLEELGVGASNSGACMGPGKWLGCNAGPTFQCINPAMGERIAEVRGFFCLRLGKQILTAS